MPITPDEVRQQHVNARENYIRELTRDIDRKLVDYGPDILFWATGTDPEVAKRIEIAYRRAGWQVKYNIHHAYTLFQISDGGREGVAQ